jgi:hypothetical protein
VWHVGQWVNRPTGRFELLEQRSTRRAGRPPAQAHALLNGPFFVEDRPDGACSKAKASSCQVVDVLRPVEHPNRTFRPTADAMRHSCLGMADVEMTNASSRVTCTSSNSRQRIHFVIYWRLLYGDSFVFVCPSSDHPFGRSTAATWFRQPAMANQTIFVSSFLPFFQGSGRRRPVVNQPTYRRPCRKEKSCIRPAEAVPAS